MWKIIKISVIGLGALGVFALSVGSLFLVFSPTQTQAAVNCFVRPATATQAGVTFTASMSGSFSPVPPDEIALGGSPIKFNVNWSKSSSVTGPNASNWIELDAQPDQVWTYTSSPLKVDSGELQKKTTSNNSSNNLTKDLIYVSAQDYGSATLRTDIEVLFAWQNKYNPTISQRIPARCQLSKVITVPAPPPSLTWDTGPLHPNQSFISQRLSGGWGTDSWRMKVSNVPTGTYVNFKLIAGSTTNNLGSKGPADSNGNIYIETGLSAIGDGAENTYQAWVENSSGSSNVLSYQIQDYDIDVTSAVVSGQPGQTVNVPVQVINKRTGFNQSVSFFPSGGWSYTPISTASSGNVPIVIPLNQAPGDYTVTMNGAYSDHGRTDTFVLRVVAPPTVDIKANGSNGPITIPYNSAATISWSSTYTTSCNIYKDASTYFSSGLSGSKSSGNLTSSTSYRADCTGPGGAVPDTVIVNVSPAPDVTASITATPSTVNYGSGSTISWSSTNADSCSVSPNGWTGTYGYNTVPSFTSDRTFTVNCSNSTSGKSASASVTVHVRPQDPTFTSFYQSCSGTSPRIYIAWSSSALADNYDFQKYANGSWSNVAYHTTATSYTDTNVNPGDTYRYRIVANNSYGQSNWIYTSYITATWCVGDINVNATLNGSPVSTSINYRISGPRNINPATAAVPNTHSDVPAGSYTITYEGGGPSGALFSGYSPSRVQTLSIGSSSKPSITFTLAFSSNAPVVIFSSAVSSCSGTDSRVSLGWSGSGATSYDVYRNGSLYYSPGLTAFYTDTNVSSGASYTYFIRATGPGGTTDSNSRSVTATWCAGDINVNTTLNGSPVSTDINYRINGSRNINPATVAVPNTHSDVPGGSYTITYESGGPSGAIFSGYSPSRTQTLSTGSSSKPSITFTLAFQGASPVAPTPNRVVNQCEQVTLYWNDNSNNERKFLIYRSDTGINFPTGYALIYDTNNPNVREYTYRPPQINRNYYYAVTAENLYGESSPALFGPIYNDECAPVITVNLSIDKINGTQDTGQRINEGDILTMKVTFANEGDDVATNINVEELTSNNLFYVPGTVRLKRGTGAFTSITDQVVNSQRVYFDNDRNLGNKTNDGLNWILTFDVRVQGVGKEAVELIEAEARVHYLDGLVSKYTSAKLNKRLIQSNAPKVPDIKEIFP